MMISCVLLARFNRIVISLSACLLGLPGPRIRQQLVGFTHFVNLLPRFDHRHSQSRLYVGWLVGKPTRVCEEHLFFREESKETHQNTYVLELSSSSSNRVMDRHHLENGSSATESFHHSILGMMHLLRLPRLLPLFFLSWHRFSRFSLLNESWFVNFVSKTWCVWVWHALVAKTLKNRIIIGELVYDTLCAKAMGWANSLFAKLPENRVERDLRWVSKLRVPGSRYIWGFLNVV